MGLRSPDAEEFARGYAEEARQRLEQQNADLRRGVAHLSKSLGLAELLFEELGRTPADEVEAAREAAKKAAGLCREAVATGEACLRKNEP